MTKPVVVWMEFAACSGCSVSFMDNECQAEEVLDKIDLKFATLLADGREIPEKIDLTIVEGGIAVTKKDLKLVKTLRERSKTLIAIGACAENSGVLHFTEGNQMPMPELDSFLPLHDVVEVDYVIPGCPPAPKGILKFLDAFLRGDTAYLEPYNLIIDKCEGKIRNIVQQGLCMSCGTCGATCPTHAISFVEGKPVIKDEICIMCGECYFQCPRSFFRFPEKTEFVTEKSVENSIIGPYISTYALRASESKIRKRAQSGGVVTALLSYALDNHYLDGAIVASDGINNWEGLPTIVKSSEDLLKSSGTKYSVCPLLTSMRDALTTEGISRLGVVGLPCQQEALQKIIDYPIGIRQASSKIALRMGLFCTSNFRYNAMKKMVEEVAGVRPADVTKIDVGAKSFIITTVTREEIVVPINTVHKYEQESCKVCPDFSSEYCDISIGSVGAPKNWSAVITRSELGAKLIEEAIRDGYLEADKDISADLSLIEKLATMKKKRAKKGMKR